MGGGVRVLAQRRSGDARRPRRSRERRMQQPLDRAPRRRAGELAGARLENVFRRVGVLVQSVPLPSQRPRFAGWNERQKRVEFSGWNSGGQGLPAVPVAEQRDEVRPHAGGLAPPNLAQADLHRLLVERRLVAHAPAQVDGLEPRAVLLAELSQLRKHVALKRIALRLQILERRADEDPECAGGGRHGAYSSRAAH